MSDKFPRKWDKPKLKSEERPPEDGAPSAPPKKTDAIMPHAASLAQKKAFFIQTLHSNGGLITRALEASGLPKRTAYSHLQSDPEFRDAWLQATEIANDELFAEARTRAIVGEKKTRVDTDGNVTYYYEKSDTLLIFLMKTHENRVKWRKRIQEAGNAALKAVRESGHSAGMTEDQIQAVQNAIMEKFKNISLV